MLVSQPVQQANKAEYGKLGKYAIHGGLLFRGQAVPGWLGYTRNL